MEVLTENRNRFSDAIWVPKNEEVVMIGGAGGIGSWLAFFLSRIGYNVHIYDFDTIEEHNLGGQLFKTSHIGKYKVTAVQEIIRDFSGGYCSAFTDKITDESPTHYYMFSAFDNMQARKDLFNVWKRSIVLNSYPAGVVPIFIDGRLELEQLQIFCVKPENIIEYERDHLFHDDVVEDAACTLKQTSHSAGMIATHMTAFFTNHIANIYEGEVWRDVPFYYEYVIPLSLTTEHR